MAPGQAAGTLYPVGCDRRPTPPDVGPTADGAPGSHVLRGTTGGADTGRWAHDQRHPPPARADGHRGRRPRRPRHARSTATARPAVHRPRRRQRRPPRRPLHRDHGPLGLGQVDAPARARRPRHAHQRARCSSATPTSSTLNDRKLTELRRDRLGLRLPGLQPGAHADGRGEHDPAVGPRRHADVDPAWLDEVVRTVGLQRPARRTARPSCPAASSSGSPWPGPW